MGFLRRVVLRNYKSIAACDVALEPLTVLVGPNGSGKSNFIDALRLVNDATRTSLEHALRERGGVGEVRRRSSGHPTHFTISLDFELPVGAGHFSFRVGAQRGAFEVQHEECRVGDHRYSVRAGSVVTMTGQVAPPASADRLYLVNAAGLPEFRPVFDAFSAMGFYNLRPERIRELQPPDQGELLARDGANLASVLERLARQRPATTKARIEEYLARVVPGIEGVDPVRNGRMESIEFRQRVEGAKDPWRFPATNMSDGTMRALGVLVALFQHGDEHRIPLVGIEEPEVALHPAAAGVLMDCLREGARNTQVLVTSHSPDLLDDPRVAPEQLLAVAAANGTTIIGPVDDVGRTALRARLYTAGELLRLDQLRPEAAPRSDAVVAPKDQLPLEGIK